MTDARSPREKAAYIAQMALELGRMADDEPLHFLRYLLQMVAVEAEDVARSTGAPDGILRKSGA